MKPLRTILSVLLPWMLFLAFIIFCFELHGSQEPTPGTREARILAALQALPRFHEDRDDLRKSDQTKLIARAIAEASKTDRELAALLVATGYEESRFSLRIGADQCKPTECDRGKAKGYWQQHVNKHLDKATWEQLVGLDWESTRLAAHHAAAAIERSRGLCSKRAGDRVAMTFAAYAGLACRDDWSGAGVRVATFKKVLRRI